MSYRVPALAAYALALGVLSAIGWRLHVGFLDLLAGLQAVWGLGAWLTGRIVGGGARRGALAGAAFGALAIGTYYVTEGVADSLHSATSQLTSSGRFWVPAALLGGAVFGALGTWAVAPDRGRWLEPAALSHAVMVGGLLAESAFVQDARRVLGSPARLELATVVLVVIALVLAGVAWIRSSTRALLAAGVVAAVTVPVLAGLFLLVEHRFGYVTL
jgi:hypothetical protein